MCYGQPYRLVSSTDLAWLGLRIVPHSCGHWPRLHNYTHASTSRCLTSLMVALGTLLGCRWVLPSHSDDGRYQTEHGEWVFFQLENYTIHINISDTARHVVMYWLQSCGLQRVVKHRGGRSFTTTYMFVSRVLYNVVCVCRGRYRYIQGVSGPLRQPLLCRMAFTWVVYFRILLIYQRIC